MHCYELAGGGFDPVFFSFKISPDIPLAALGTGSG